MATPTPFVGRNTGALVGLVIWTAMNAQAEQPTLSTPAEPYPITHTRSRFTFAPVGTADEWALRQAYIRQHILVSAGLWPMPPKCDPKPERLDAKTFDGFVREKIYFWSFPGVMVTGALYTPTGAQGRLPAVLCPHGHWKLGRLDEPPQARFINFAKQGYVVLAIDMVGYNDNGPIPHDFGGDMVYGLSLGGLQLWNCIRSIDVLASLEHVDPDRIGVTGASGGGTQTFMVSAVDDRVRVAAPVCMISAHFQGGCLCENAPLMRVVMNNMEIGAAMAPRPLVLVSATGDWTKDTPQIEYPAIRRVYELMGAPERIAHQQFNLGHNYDKPSREVVYAWFARWLKGAPADTKVPESPYELDNDLRIFTTARPRPTQAVPSATFIEYWQGMVRAQLEELVPRDAASLKRLRDVLGIGLAHTFCVEPCSRGHLTVETGPPQTGQGYEVRGLQLGLKHRGAWLTGKLWAPPSILPDARGLLLVHPKGAGAVGESMIRALTGKNCVVLAIDPLPLGQRKPTDDRFYYTYNRSNLAIRVQEIMIGLAALAERPEVRRVDLVGFDQAGLWALFARALSGATKLGGAIIDACRFDGSSPSAWRENEMFSPGILRIGGTDTAGALIAPAQLVIHNTGQKFQTRTIEAAYRAADAAKNLRVVSEKMTDQAIVEWMIAP